MASEPIREDRNTPEYLSQLLKDKKQMQAFPNVFLHLERILDEEINRVRGSLFHLNSSKEQFALPEPVGNVITLSEKLYVPVKDHPEFNFVGRILGPRGMTAKQLEQDTGCKIMVRGKGSMRDKKKEELNRGKPNWEHLNEDLHVLITVEDTENRSKVKIRRAVEEVKKLLVPSPEGEDELNKMQLMELAIINGTYRDGKAANAAALAHLMELDKQGAVSRSAWLGAPVFRQDPTDLTGQRLLSPHMAAALQPGIRSPTPGGQIILTSRFPSVTVSQASTTSTALMNGAPPPLMSPADMGPMSLYAGALGSPQYQYAEFPYSLAHATLLEYPQAIDASAAGAVPKMRRSVGMREHPYNRVSLA